ncbi:fucolectin-3-like [Asterias amurensis]|uniref:fucolectin-3-like n=1 Tax=Asterias amurensis TaxID=7602 RepID=UPI003AB3AADB
MAHSEKMLLDKTLWIFLFGILVWFHPLSCWCLNLTVLNLQGMQATQVSTSQHYGVNLSADLAIDGDQRTNADRFSCTHTLLESHPWWKVDLGANHCLGRITLVNRADCCNNRLSGAIVRAGNETDIFSNAACGLPVTSDQASIPGAHIKFLCDPLVIARYVSVDILLKEAGGKLTLCEVIVEEYQMGDCLQSTAAMTKDTPFAIAEKTSSLLFEGKCIVDPRPLSVLHMKSMLRCFQRCLRMENECWSFDYVMTSGQCRLYDVKTGDLIVDDQPGCKVYVVVSRG